MRIVYDAEKLVTGRGQPAVEKIYIVATGDTVDAVASDARRQADAIGATLGMVVGLRNTRADFEEFSGLKTNPEHWFSDTPTEPTRTATWWERLFGTAQERAARRR